ncbi:MAG: DUF427 domain-containing protein [Acidimicrobiales bacterium]
MSDTPPIPPAASAQPARPRPLPRPEPDPVGPGQESVWAYPRPPRVEPTAELVEVFVEPGGDRAPLPIARCHGGALRVLETASPPTYYLPQSTVTAGVLVASFGRSVCEWKGEARYFAVRAGGVEVEQAAWSYPEPWEGFEALAGMVSFYPGRVACFVDGERVRPQDGGFYGGWVTDRVVGPWKGAPGSGHW